jgi:hypothetical protein
MPALPHLMHMILPYQLSSLACHANVYRNSPLRSFDLVVYVVYAREFAIATSSNIYFDSLQPNVSSLFVGFCSMTDLHREAWVKCRD